MNVEGESRGYYNATYFGVVTAGDTWVKVLIKGYDGREFSSRHIRFKVIGAGPVNISFDPIETETHVKMVHGHFASGETVLMHDKHAGEIWVRRSGGVDSDIEIMAWRS